MTKLFENPNILSNEEISILTNKKKLSNLKSEIIINPELKKRIEDHKNNYFLRSNNEASKKYIGAIFDAAYNILDFNSQTHTEQQQSEISSDINKEIVVSTAGINKQKLQNEETSNTIEIEKKTINPINQDKYDFLLGNKVIGVMEKLGITRSDFDKEIKLDHKSIDLTASLGSFKSYIDNIIKGVTNTSLEEREVLKKMGDYFTLPGFENISQDNVNKTEIMSKFSKAILDLNINIKKLLDVNSGKDFKTLEFIKQGFDDSILNNKNLDGEKQNTLMRVLYYIFIKATDKS